MLGRGARAHNRGHVDQRGATTRRGRQSGLVVQRYLRTATSIGRRQLVMVVGRIERVTTAEQFRDDPALQEQYLGVDA